MLERGRANLTSAGVFEADRHVFVAADVFAWLGRAAARGERFDLVVVDPASYSTTKRGRFRRGDPTGVDIPRQAPSRCWRQTAGFLACTNHRGISGPLDSVESSSTR